jgi:hypothetical protein
MSRSGSSPMSQSDPVIADPAIVVHSLGHAVAALRAASADRRRILLLSAPDAGGYAGAGWFRALVDAAHEAVPEARFSAFLDCGDAIGPALAALRAGIKDVVFTGRPDVARRLANIASQQGARVATARPANVLDLGADFFADEARLMARCAAFLSRAVPPAREDQATRS